MESHKAQIPRQGLPDEGSAAPSGMTSNRGAGASTPPKNLMAPSRKSKAAVPVDHSAAIAFALDAATEVVTDEDLDELDWPVVLKSKVQDHPTPFSDGDLRRYLRQAKLNRDGRKDFIRPNDELKSRDDEWLWRGVVMRQATNMIFALPKVGKTRLILAMLSEFVKGRGEFAGVPLHPGSEKVLLLGPDQSESSWSSYLSKADLLDAGSRLHNRIVALTTAETMFTLDHYWLSRVEEQLREHGPLIVLLDSYAASIRGLGLDENKSESATPLMQLHNLVSQYESTLIVIHHSNKGGGDGNAAKASRGSSAISACADNLIEMSVHRGSEEDGVKKYELNVEGRAETDGVPLIGYSKQSAEWISYGSLSDLRAEARKDSSYDALTQAQLVLLNALVEATTEENRGQSVNSLGEALHETPTKAQKVWISKTLNRFVDIGLAYEKTSGASTSGTKEKLYLATGWAVSKHQVTF